MIRTAVLLAARTCGLFALSRWLTRGQLRILCYHGIWTGPQPHYGDCLFMSPERFAARMAGLARGGYRVLSLDDACRRLPSGELGARDVVVTIDDAWAGIVPRMLPPCLDLRQVCELCDHEYLDHHQYMPTSQVSLRSDLGP